MLLDRHRSLLLIVDVQQRLLPAMHESSRLLRNCTWLLNLANELAVPSLASEQYPRGLGPTVPELRERAADGTIIEKLHFSCAADPAIHAAVKAAGRDQLVIAGIESHVCVLQSALGFLADSFEVFVVADAVASRSPANVELALARVRQAGATVVSGEMLGYEWLQRAGTDEFRHISRRFLR